MLKPYIKTIENYPDKIIYFYGRRINSASTMTTADKVAKLISSSKEFYILGLEGVIEKDIAMSEIYANMTQVMFYISTLPRKNANKMIKQLEGISLFPLKKNKEHKNYNEPISKETTHKRILNKLKRSCYTRIGYLSLRVFRFLLKLKKVLKNRLLN